ncbi:MAG: hypothetical protein ACOC5T_00555 [Elusimicrobiota bacterium]
MVAEKTMNSFCPKCDEFSDIRVVAETETYTVRGDEISVNAQVAYCNTCDSKIFNEKLDEKNLDLAYTKYRKKHNLSSTETIIEGCKKYGN